MSFLGMTRNSLGTRHCVTKKKSAKDPVLSYIPLLRIYFPSYSFVLLCSFFFSFHHLRFFMVSHDLRLCFLELVHFFFVPQTFILQSIHTSSM